MASRKRKGERVKEAPPSWDSSRAVAWWRQADPGEALEGCVEKLLELDEPRQRKYEKLWRLYGIAKLIGIRPWETPSDLKAEEREQRDSLRLNICAAVTDTLTAKVGKLRPRPTFLTNGGNWKLQQRAKQLQKFMDGAYHQSDTYEVAPDVFRDAVVCGTGVFHPLACGKRIANERVPAIEFTVDPRDAMYGKPRRLYRCKWVSTEAVAEEWGDDVLVKAGETRAADDETGQEAYVRVIEAWHLPSDDFDPSDHSDFLALEEFPAIGSWPKGCGRHVLQVGKHVIDDTPWTSPEFPFVFVHYKRPVQGFWGMSALDDIVGIQVEVNKLIQSVQRAMQLVGQPWVLKRDGVVLSPSQTTNAIGQEYVIDQATGSLEEALKVVTFQPVPNQVYNHIWTLTDRAYSLVGISELTASANAPAGMESARGLERLSDEQSDRFSSLSHHFEYCVGEALARQFIRVAKELDASLEGGFTMRAPGQHRKSDVIKWSEVQMDEDGYLIQVFQTSVLPTQPSARVAEVQRLSDSQWIDKEEARRLIRLPDLEESDDLATADEDNLQRQIGMCLEEGKPVVATPYQDLVKAITKGQQALLRAEFDGAPARNLDLLRDFITSAETLKAMATPPAAPDAAAASAGMLPPTTDAAPPGAAPPA